MIMDEWAIGVVVILLTFGTSFGISALLAYKTRFPILIIGLSVSFINMLVWEIVRAIAYSRVLGHSIGFGLEQITSAIVGIWLLGPLSIIVAGIVRKRRQQDQDSAQSTFKEISLFGLRGRLWHIVLGISILSALFAIVTSASTNSSYRLLSDWEIGMPVVIALLLFTISFVITGVIEYSYKRLSESSAGQRESGEIN